MQCYSMMITTECLLDGITAKVVCKCGYTTYFLSYTLCGVSKTEMKGNGIWNEIMCRNKGLLKGGAKGFTKCKELCLFFP